MSDGDGFVQDMGPEVVQSHGEMFDSGSGAMIRGNFNAAPIVLKDSAMNFRRCEI